MYFPRAILGPCILHTYGVFINEVVSKIVFEPTVWRCHAKFKAVLSTERDVIVLCVIPMYVGDLFASPPPSNHIFRYRGVGWSTSSDVGICVVGAPSHHQQ